MHGGANDAVDGAENATGNDYATDGGLVKDSLDGRDSHLIVIECATCFCPYGLVDSNGSRYSRLHNNGLTCGEVQADAATLVGI